MRHSIKKRPLRGKEILTGLLSGSMTVEAALVIPLCLFFFVNILYSIEMIRLESNLSTALHQAGNRIAYYAYFYEYAPEGVAGAVDVLGSAGDLGNAVASVALSETYVRGKVNKALGEAYLNHTCLRGGSGSISYLRSRILAENDIVQLVADYRAGPLIPLIAYDAVSLQSRYYGHAWVGYSIGGTEEMSTEEEDEETVFITESGRVYHRERSCTYLMPSLHGIAASDIAAARNESGAKYYPCESCHPAKTGTLLITNEGNRYHRSKDCSAIKRTVREVKLSSVVNRMPPCSKCGY
ncbi:MAG: hypothetical protein J5935_05550 [Lachnospiraceae bacterium]|nr:hypothetical protein [Lachnospiraceae bacterium]